jgi:hypothetical protein
VTGSKFILTDSMVFLSGPQYVLLASFSLFLDWLEFFFFFFFFFFLSVPLFLACSRIKWVIVHSSRPPFLKFNDKIKLLLPLKFDTIEIHFFFNIFLMMSAQERKKIRTSNFCFIRRNSSRLNYILRTNALLLICR